VPLILSCWTRSAGKDARSEPLDRQERYERNRCHNGPLDALKRYTELLRYHLGGPSLGILWRQP